MVKLNKQKWLITFTVQAALILAAAHVVCRSMLSDSYFDMLCRSPLDFASSVILAFVFSYTDGTTYLQILVLLFFVLLGTILTFPLGWLALWLGGQFNMPWLIFPGMLANVILWAWMLWHWRIPSLQVNREDS